MGVVCMALIVEPDADDFALVVHHIAEDRILDRGERLAEKTCCFGDAWGETG